MDTSSKYIEYIEMCKKAKEIQKEPRSHTWWFPRQDELQNMYGSYGDILALICTFGDGNPPVDPEDYGSMEQLWLAIVMKEKFGKVWNGKEWTETAI